MRPGCYDPKERVKDMDIDGVWAQLCFPSLPKFAGTFFLNSRDRELARLCIEAYNDFMIDEWCGYAPDRFIPMTILPLWDADACVAEVSRTAAKGARAISFPENPVPLGLPSWYTEHWDGVFAAAQEADLPLCMHFGTSGQVPMTAPEAPFAVGTTLMGTNSMAATADLIFSPVFYRFPGLKIALSEGGIGWVPYLLERADHVWERHRFYDNVNKDVRPSELFRKHIWGCFIDDEFGLASREAIGVDKIMWEGDYPHADSDWPNTGKRAAELLAEVPDGEAHRIVELNARELFNFPASG
jgi:predicted TIM-barrel fold metal-dependent hydrolase